MIWNTKHLERGFENPCPMLWTVLIFQNLVVHGHQIASMVQWTEKASIFSVLMSLVMKWNGMIECVGILKTVFFFIFSLECCEILLYNVLFFKQSLVIISVFFQWSTLCDVHVSNIIGKMTWTSFVVTMWWCGFIVFHPFSGNVLYKLHVVSSEDSLFSFMWCSV